MNTESTLLDVSFEKLLNRRFSCRGFRPDLVERPTIDRLLRLAQRTPSWCNTQPWQVTVMSGTATKRFSDALTERATSGAPMGTDIDFPEAYEGIYLDRRRESGFQLYDSVGIQKGDRKASADQGLENFRLFGAPHVAIITTERKLGTYGAIDCGGYISNFTLAAAALGLASIPQAAIASQSNFVREFLSLPEDRLVVCGISFGFENDKHPANSFRANRADIGQVAKFLDD